MSNYRLNYEIVLENGRVVKSGIDGDMVQFPPDMSNTDVMNEFIIRQAMITGILTDDVVFFNSIQISQ